MSEPTIREKIERVLLAYGIADLVAEKHAVILEPLVIEMILEEVKESLGTQIHMWEGVSSGVDYDADESDESPQDATAHLAGLAIKQARQRIATLEAQLSAARRHP